MDYSDANIVHFSELVYEDEYIKISPETIRLWLIEEKIISTKTHIITKNRIKKRCREELKKTIYNFLTRATNTSNNY